MSAYNSEDVVSEAVDSVLAQSYGDFDFIVIDDASTDGTLRILQEYASVDSRVRILKNEVNLGLAGSLNRGLSLAKTPYVARMDADDFSFPHRLQMQLEYMRKRQEVTVLGGFVTVAEEHSVCWRLPLTHQEITARMLFECGFFHPTVMFRREAVNLCGGYSTRYRKAQDYDLWVRMHLAGVGNFENINEPLVRYRVRNGLDRSVHRQEQSVFASQVRQTYLQQLGLANHLAIEQGHIVLSGATSVEQSSLGAVEEWLRAITVANGREQIFEPLALRRELEQRWRSICLRRSGLESGVAWRYVSSDFAPVGGRMLLSVAGMIFRSIVH
jgi:hypothetical protein